MGVVGWSLSHTDAVRAGVVGWGLLVAVGAGGVVVWRTRLCRRCLGVAVVLRRVLRTG